MENVSILFVCLGNICRSPTAEGVFRQLSQASLSGYKLHIDSAGTTGYHIGESPDGRARKSAQKRGYDLSYIRSRTVNEIDFEVFDYILVMDKENLVNCQRLALQSGNAHKMSKIELFLDYAIQFSEQEVPDPYYGGDKGFDLVIDLIEDASRGLIRAIKNATNN